MAPKSTLAVERGTFDLIDTLAPLFDAYRQFYQQAPDLAGARAFLAERLATGESVLFLATLTHDGQARPAGFAQLYPTYSSIALRRCWVLNDLYVVPEARRQGVARALMEAVASFARGTGAKSIALETAADNHAARPLYETLGYVTDTTFLHYYLYL